MNNTSVSDRMHSLRLDLRLGIGLYLINIIVRLLLLWYPPDRFFYNLDELDLTFSCLDRFIGLPTTVPMEPSTVLQMISIPVIAVDFLARHLVPHRVTVDAFAEYFADAYADPRHHVLLLRAVVALVASAAPVLLFAICRKFQVTVVCSLLSGMVLSLVPGFFLESLMVAGDSMGLTAILASIFGLLSIRNSNTSHLVAGFCFAMAVGFKLTMASSIVVLLAIMIADVSLVSLKTLGGNLGKFAAGCILGVLVFWPYLWSDPIRTTKSVVANVNKPGPHLDLAIFVARAREGLGPLFLLFIALLVFTVAWMWFKQNGLLSAAALIAGMLLIAIPLLMRATSTYPRYYIALAVPALISFAVATRSAVKLSAIALSLLLVGTAVSLYFQQRAAHASDPMVTAIRNIPDSHASVSIYIPEEGATTYVIPLPRATYVRASEHTKEILDSGSATVEYLRNHGLSNLVANVFINAFNEDEQGNAGHMAAAAQSDGKRPAERDIRLYRPVSKDRAAEIIAQRESWTDLDERQAQQQFLGSAPAAILTKIDERIPGRIVWQNTEWAWHVNEAWTSLRH